MSYVGVWLYVVLFAGLLAAGGLMYVGITGQRAFARRYAAAQIRLIPRLDHSRDNKDTPAGEFRLEGGSMLYVVDGKRVAERVGEGDWVSHVPGWHLEDAYSGQTGGVVTLVFYDPEDAA
jgi:hypothetical protein